jgi:hypothetical protein
MNEEQIIKNAQYRKGLSIAFFNATNASIELVSKFIPQDEKIEDIKKTISEWRDWFLEEHKNYYAKVVANVGQKYNVLETIKKLQNTKTLEELKSAWIASSEDERRDGEIIREVNILKKSYEKA